MTPQPGDIVRVRPHIHALEGKLNIGDVGYVLHTNHPVYGVGYFRFPMLGDYYLMMESVEKVGTAQ